MILGFAMTDLFFPQTPFPAIFIRTRRFGRLFGAKLEEAKRADAGGIRSCGEGKRRERQGRRVTSAQSEAVLRSPAPHVMMP